MTPAPNPAPHPAPLPPRRALLLTVRLLDGRYHGERRRDDRPQTEPDWPPSPFRLFQALVAGAYGGRWAGEPAAEKDAAFRWLEALDPPLIAVPPIRVQRTVRSYVPNNDLDAVGGDPERAAEIRVEKSATPVLLDPGSGSEGDDALLYAWLFPATPEAEAHSARIALLVERLHRLGRGVDAAWAVAELLDADAAEARLARHGGAIARPAAGMPGTGGTPWRCPVPGSLDSLQRRHAAAEAKLQALREGRSLSVRFSRPPLPSFRPVAYDRPTARLPFVLSADDRDRTEAGPALAGWPLTDAATLVVRARDAAAARLRAALPEERHALVDRFLVGDSAGPDDKAARIRLLPLPSIGFRLADPAIRRLLVEVPPDCPLRPDLVAWAFGGLDLGPRTADPEMGEIAADPPLPPGERAGVRGNPDVDQAPTGGPVLAAATGAEARMLRPYGIGTEPSRHWRTVTPAALPDPGTRAGTGAGRQDGSARTAAETAATARVLAALRHAGIAAPVLSVELRREPWSLKGAPADRFRIPPGRSGRPRWTPGALAHVSVEFALPVAGPLAIGDGRWLGLGVMAPVTALRPDRQRLPADPAADLALFRLDPPVPDGDRAGLLLAARRALMSLARTPDGGVAPLFSGHGPGWEEPARSGRHAHVFLAAWGGGAGIDRLCVAAPWTADRSWSPTLEDRLLFARVTAALAILRTGPLGTLTLAPAAEGERTALLAPAAVWRSLTPYVPNRHPHGNADPTPALADDIGRDCDRRGLPAVTVEILERSTGPRGGITLTALLRFPHPIPGPLLLGRDAHQGGGLFRQVE